jgi:hypothetical protein
MSRGTFKMGRCTYVICRIAKAKHDQICSALFSRCDDSLGWFTIFDGCFRRHIELSVLRDCIVEFLKRLSHRKFETSVLFTVS